MAETTGISWCCHTFNPWIGCTKVSAACDFCYAETLMDHRYHRVQWGGPRVLTSDANWKLPRRWNRKAKETGVRRRVFCASLADVFDNQVPDDWRVRLWDLIRQCPDLDWLLLTKRPQNIVKMLPPDWAARGAYWPHVWLGTTAENQTEFDRRWPHLAAVQAAIRFISYEPALDELSLMGVSPWPDWIICGGESGKQARGFDFAWPFVLMAECRELGIPFFMKQIGDNPRDGMSRARGGNNPEEWPEEMRVREFPRQEGS